MMLRTVSQYQAYSSFDVLFLEEGTMSEVKHINVRSFNFRYRVQ